MDVNVKYIDKSLPKLQYIGGFGTSLGLDIQSGEDVIIEIFLLFTGISICAISSKV